MKLWWRLAVAGLACVWLFGVGDAGGHFDPMGFTAVFNKHAFLNPFALFFLDRLFLFAGELGAVIAFIARGNL